MQLVRFGRASNDQALLKLALEIASELNDQAQLLLGEERFDVAHDPGAPVNREPLADLERLFAAEVAGRDHLITAPELVSVVRHRRVPVPRLPRYACESISLVVRPARSTVASKRRRTTSRSAPRSRQSSVITPSASRSGNPASSTKRACQRAAAGWKRSSSRSANSNRSRSASAYITNACSHAACRARLRPAYPGHLPSRTHPTRAERLWRRR